MADYIRQPNFNQPTRGQNTISHMVECLTAADTATLQTDVNAFLSSLVAIPETPQIIDIKFIATRNDTEEDYSALVHYVLIS